MPFSFLNFSCHLGAMVITGQQLRAARNRAGWTQEGLAERLGTSHRSIGNWERSNPPANREALLREVLGDHLAGGTNPLADVSDVALLAEVGRRMAQGGQQWATGTPGPEDDGDDGGVVRPFPDPRYDPDMHQADAAAELTDRQKAEQQGDDGDE